MKKDEINISNEKERNSLIMEEEQEKILNTISPEGNKDYNIIEINDISPFDDDKLEKLNELPYYFKRKIIDEILENNEITFPYLIKILNHDDTYDKVQSLYLNELITLLNQVNIEDTTKNKIIEKIQKSSIILSQIVYENKIKNIKLKLDKDLNYINYKDNVIQVLEYILTLQKKERNESYIIKAKNILNIRKKYNFGKEPELGDNNYYFYKLSECLYYEMDNVFEYLDYLYFIIKKILAILKSENLDATLKQNEFQFRYLINVLLDHALISNMASYERVVNFIESKDFDISKLNKKIHKIKSQNEFFQHPIKYDINLEENEIKYTIEEKSKIGKKNYIKYFKKVFNLKMFNKGIIKALTNDLSNFESDLFESTKFNKEYCSEYYQPFKKAFNVILTNILKSKAAQNFFKDKYKKKYSYLKYHFDNDLLIEEVLKKITFAPIFSCKLDAYTDPIDLNITINSIPGKYGHIKTEFYNKKVLQLGRIILIALHEILGHFMRRYYHYSTHGKISFWTKEDNSLYTGEENGFYIEYEFVGINHVIKSTLSIYDALCLLNLDKFDDYPLEKNNKFIINKEILENIVYKNKEIFDFIGNKPEQIKFEDYLDSLISIDSYNIHRRLVVDEDFIYLNKFLY